jgi:SOS-response transcriptional repressor LexA
MPDSPSNIVPLSHGKTIRQNRWGPSNARILTPEELVMTPIINWDRALDWLELKGDFETDTDIVWIPLRKRHGPRTFGLVVRDHAMTYRDDYECPAGSVIFTDPDEADNVEEGDRVLALLDDGETLVFRELEGTWRKRLVAIHPDFPPIKEPFRVLGKVVSRLI